jgi:hypothetical protein
MAEELPSLHIDNDWKKQAQEEKRRLAEEAQKKTAPPAAPAGGPGPAPMPAAGGAPGGRGGTGGRGGQRELPPAAFGSLVNSIVTQALYYLGELSPSGGEPMLNLDMAKHQIDTLAVLEEKTANNLDEEERRLLDGALYESRSRFVNVASQFI